uniref:Uncharacterized protein n=1 Tax=Latimeria chalumnae TaxID=7897 RepID=H3AE49_LATCH
DREPLEDCIQSALSALYPPFEATAPTLLAQVFDLVEKTYCEDALRYTIEFLVPAKHILQRLQQEACAQYNGFLFRHEGWPLCLHEKVVVQLSALNWQALQPGDFYLQMIPYLERSPKLVLKCLSRDGFSVQEVIVPEESYPYIFTVEWLNGINKDRNTTRLETCLLSADSGVVRVSWQEVVYPQFIHKEGITVGSRHSEGGLTRRSPDGIEAIRTQGYNFLEISTAPVDQFVGPEEVLSNPLSETSKRTQEKCKSTKEYIAETHRGTTCLEKFVELEEASTEDIEGEYVELLDIANPKYPPQQESPSIDSHDFQCLNKKPGSRSSPKPRAVHPLCASKSRKHKPKRGCQEIFSNPQPDLKDQQTETQVQAHVAETDCNSKPTSQNTDNEQLPNEPSCTNCKHTGKPKASSCTNHDLKAETLEVFIETHSLAGCKFQVSSEAQPLAEQGDSSSASNQVEGNTEGARGAVDTQQMPKRNANSKEERTVGFFFLLLFWAAEAPVKASSQSNDCFSLIDSAPIDPTCQISDEGTSSPAPQTAPNTESAEREELTVQSQGSSQLAPPPPGCPSYLQDVNQEILQSGVFCLTGSRDRHGRVMVVMMADNPLWQSWCYSSVEAARVLMYYQSIPRQEVRDLGLTVLVDACASAPLSALFEILCTFQEFVPNGIHSVLVLLEEDSPVCMKNLPNMQVEIVTSLQALQKHIDPAQLPQRLGGGFPYSHQEWIDYPQRVEKFGGICREVISYLQSVIHVLETRRLPQQTQDIPSLIEQHQALMMDVLADRRLTRLQLEGGTTLARLHKENSHISVTEDYRDSISVTSTLYNEAEDCIHQLVKVSNQYLRGLEALMKLQELEERLCKVS